MLKKLLEQLKQKKIEKENNRPQFKLGNLYVGEIVLYTDREDIGFGTRYDHYNIVKKFAIFTEAGYNKYCHIKSGQMLYEMGSYKSVVGDYAVHNVRKFQDAFPIFMRNHNFTPDTKVSLRFIIENEDKLNKELAEHIEVNELFEYPFDIN